MTAPREGGRVLRFPKAPLRAVARAGRVKARPRRSGAGFWRLKLKCEHTVTLLKRIESIAEAVPPERVPCWLCLAHGAPPLVS